MKRILLIFAVCANAMFASAQTSGNRTTPADDEALLRNWISTLGSDEFGGRKPMTGHEAITINYLADQMKAIGLQPAFGGSWFQKVKTISADCKLPGNRLRVKGRRKADLIYPDDLVVWTSRAEDKVVIPKAEFVFCGFGIDAPEFNWNDFEGVDVKGKIIIAMVNDPGFYDAEMFQGKNMTYHGRWTCKFEVAEKLGAAGCLVLHNTAAASYGWNVCKNGHTAGNLALYDEETGNRNSLAIKGWLHEEGCRKIFEAAGLDFDKAVSDARKPGFKAIPLKVKGDVTMNVKYEINETCNVAGILPGTDLKKEAVVFSAHWDHFGYADPDKTGDRIYNGAADNGSGMAAVLLLAKKYASLKERPRRSMIFLIPTLEESGLFGSEYYCAHPVIPMEKTAACINFDCIAPEPLTYDAVVLGGGKTILDKYIIAAAGAQGRYVVFNDDNSDGWFFRSNHFNFVKKGVPAVVIEYGTDLVDPSRPNKYPRSQWYHKPSDEYREDWDFSGTLAHINMMFAVGLSVANAN